MKRESLFYKILSGIHIVFFVSMLTFGITFVTAGILMIPAIAAAFQMGRDQLYKKLDISDSTIGVFFHYLKHTMKLCRFIPINLIFLGNLVAAFATIQLGKTAYAVWFLCAMAFLLVLIFYLAGYYTFVDEKVRLTDLLISMFYKPQFLIPLFSIMVLVVCFFNGTVAAILFFAGAFFAFAVEVVIFIQMLYYRELLGTLDEDEEFIFLVKRKGKVK